MRNQEEERGEAGCNSELDLWETSEQALSEVAISIGSPSPATDPSESITAEVSRVPRKPVEHSIGIR